MENTARKSGRRKNFFTILKVIGITIGVILLTVVTAVSSLLYYESHDASDMNGIDKKEFSCYRGELKIRGTVFMPTDCTDAPIAVVCHEFMTKRLFSYPYATALARNGYAAFCFDFCGGGIVCSSDGDSRDMSVLTEMEDLKAVMNFAKEQSYTNDEPLLLMGCSQGGLVAALTAAELQEEIGGLILQYPALAIPNAARKGEMLWMSFDPNNVPEEMRSGPMRLGSRYATDVMNIDTLPTISKFTGKVLIIHGSKDKIVNISGSQKAVEAYEAAGTDVTFKIIPGAGHIFLKPKEIKSAIDNITKFTETL